MKLSRSQYDFLYNPRLSVPDFAAIASRWEKESARTRARLDSYLDVPYGSGVNETMDIFLSQGPSKALLIFIHGGYWRAQDKAGYSFLANELTREGVTLAIPNYALCPSVEVHDIVMQMVQACSWLYRNGPNFGGPADRLFVFGHSAGGHLTAMMLACLWPIYAADLPRSMIKGGLSISGVFDLREIVKVASINNDVRLTRRSALAVSPCLLPPATDAPLFLAVGADETGGFHLQHRVMSEKWKRVLAGEIFCPDSNHFTIIDELTRPKSALFEATLRMIGI